MRPTIILAAVAFLTAGCRGSDPEYVDWSAMHAAVPDLMQLPAAEDTSAGGYLAGRLAIVGNGFGGMNSDQHSLWTPLGMMTARDSALLATTVEDVGTVARLDCGQASAQSYGDASGTRAGIVTQQMCDLTLVDRSRQTVVHRHRFYGPEPPAGYEADATESLSTRVMPVAMDDVMRYLEALPRR